MKKLFAITVAAFMLSCQKEQTVKQDSVASLTAFKTTQAAMNAAMKQDNTELQMLIRQWTEWAYSTNAAIAPFNDPDSSLQYINQPTSSIFMLAGSSSPDPVSRTVTISLSQYQYVFAPLVELTAWYSPCDRFFAPKGGESADVAFQRVLKEAFNGPRDLTLLWDGTSLLSTKQKELRTNSGAWDFTIDPSWNSGDCSTSTPVLSTIYSDGYWAKIPLTLGTHTLTLGGSADLRRFKYEFSNMVTYTINVIP